MITVIKLIIIIAISIFCIYLYPYLNLHKIGIFVKENRIAAPFIFILLTALRPILFFLPSMGLTIVAGMLFGAVWGTVYVIIGGVFSTLIGFYFARWLGRGIIEKLVEKNKLFKRVEKRSRGCGKNAVLYMRLFNLPWDMVSYWAGLSGINFKDFYIASMIPLVPISFLYTYFGSHMFAPTSAGFIISVSMLFAMGATPYVKARFMKRTYD
ncbi:MAG: putative DedA family protein [Candidatus Jettenia ecosi]|uniref:TVP38/TMEM64 family membrane protein n=1 Tax=Candidatus Jettenia ecosi TaxID=2494326 RepID=A0A533QAK9_9BACT|nr:MAG: putative DedA family protein [Candidatus Jettenia ecosi]